MKAAILSRVLLVVGGLGIAAAVWAAAQIPAQPEALQVRPYFLALSVRDADKSAEWYRRTLGFQPLRSVEVEHLQAKIRILKREGALLELVEIADARDLGEIAPNISRRQYLRGVFKFGFEVADLDKALARLGELQVELRGGVVTEADKTLRSAQILDPDGNVIQLFEVLD